MKVLKNPYACGYCDESFTIARSLVIHVQTKHLPPKPTNHEEKDKDIPTTRREEFVVLPFPLRLLPWSPPPQPVARARSAGNNEKIKQLLTALLP